MAQHLIDVVIASSTRLGDQRVQVFASLDHQETNGYGPGGMRAMWTTGCESIVGPATPYVKLACCSKASTCIICLPVVAPQVDAPGKAGPPKGAGAPHVEPAAGKFAGLDPTPKLVRIRLPSLSFAHTKWLGEERGSLETSSRWCRELSRCGGAGQGLRQLRRERRIGIVEKCTATQLSAQVVHFSLRRGVASFMMVLRGAWRTLDRTWSRDRERLTT